MKHPWEEISLKDYEAHMSLDHVRQLQAMKELMARQFAQYTADTVMILGVAGGNGLEHIAPNRFKRVYGVDINPEYVKICRERHSRLARELELFCCDLTSEETVLPQADLVVANLLVEYIGYGAFQRVLRQVCPRWVSCGIQINIGESFVSESPYLHVFDRLEEVYRQMESQALAEAMETISYSPVLREDVPLPNGKALVRLDFEKNRYKR